MNVVTQDVGATPDPRLLVGRDTELAQLEAFLAAGRTDGAALLLTGPPGIGKSALLDAVAVAAAASNTRVLRAAGVEFEAEMSFSGLNQLLLPLLNELVELPALQRDALSVALGLSGGTPPDRLVVSMAALFLLRQKAASQPLLLVLDDVPWLDRASAAVLAFVARRVRGSRIGLLGAARTGEGQFFDHLGLPELSIEPLSDTASGRILDSRYPLLPSAVRSRILEDAQGNALALLELPLALGATIPASTDELPSTLPLGRRLDGMFRSRIGDLPPGTRRLLLLMALDGTGDVRVLEASSSRGAVFGDLGPAELAGLASMNAGTRRLEFRHPLMRSAVVDLSTAEERRTAHRALAALFEDQPDRRAWHLAEATVDPDELVAAELEVAATRNLARGDAIGCIRALIRASELSPQSSDRQRRLAAAAYIAAEVAGNLGHAAQVLAELRSGNIETKESLPSAVAASASLLQRDGDIATAHRVLVGAIESREGPLDAGDPVIADALYSLMVVCRYGGERRLWQPFERAMARTVSVPRVLEFASKTFANPAYAGNGVLEQLESAISAMGDEADPTQIVWIGRAATYVDRLERCRPALWRLVSDARSGGAVASGITSLILLARDDFEAGNWDEAEQLATEASDLCEAHGYHALIWPSRHLQALVAAGRGDDERVNAITDDVLSWTAERGIRVGEWFAAQVRSLAALGRGDFEEAYRQTCTITQPGVLAPYSPGALYVIVDLVDAALRTGRDAEAAAHVAAMNEANLSAVSSRLALVVGGATAMVASEERSIELFRETLNLPDVQRWQFDYGRVRLAYGERLRRRRTMVEARVELNSALAIFERLAARPWAERARSELRATGQLKPRDNVLDRLTPQEFEVATLAASGLTNKQIADRMFLSHRTVSGHLHRAFPKLGVATRAALRDALESLPAEQRQIH